MWHYQYIIVGGNPFPDLPWSAGVAIIATLQTETYRVITCASKDSVLSIMTQRLRIISDNPQLNDIAKIKDFKRYRQHLIAVERRCR